ncbi:protein translocase subunit SecD [Aestuariirhabdus litorea]|uniref:Protein translocase subunit SecD n=1 Tax=Aestuariirhabdus litorea TaxID=2528527 RepID=A0A3P3VSK1_9GAMM|nr:protein translocase subunit SecD [Aestuariirhabdus litorea]RRJ85297.1 protein translocase subunit SecD [Aestuariirhabdus litorea]RWW98519.1 protein translocase subunit SecD [Endozoicomonadaceae bacterium GTF-13]
MLNKYPFWKYLLIVVALVVGAIYALPNLYPDDPSIQISGLRTSLTIDQRTIERAEKSLVEANIPLKASELLEKSALLRLTDIEDQLAAKEAIQRAMGDDYVVALNLAPTTPEWLSSLGAGPMKLGLDLSGGVHFLLEVDMQRAVDTRLKVYNSEVRTLLRKERLRYRSAPDLDNGARQLMFADEQTRDEAVSRIADEFQELAINSYEEAEGFFLSFTLKETQVREIEDYAIKQNLTTVRNRVNELGVSEPLVQRQGRNRIVVQLPGVQDTAEAKRILGKTANLEFRLEATADAAASSTETFPFKENRQAPARLERNIIISGDRVSNAQSNFDENGRPQVNIRLDSSGGQLMNRATRDNVGRRMAVLFIEQKPTTRIETQEVNGEKVQVRVPGFREEREVISLATIQSALGTSFRITGLDGVGEASELALLLRAGALAAPMYFVEERTVGPSLGKDNIRMGINSVVIGFALVLIFMLVYYKVFGLFANIALTLNLALLVALMSMLSATLTLPGIAGIVLTVGMAVDANVLIFSRIKEELKNGLSAQRAIHEGYDRAFVTILDANITTLLVAVILYAVGTGPVKGFAVTLSLGIIISMFTAIVVTRAMVNLSFGGRQLKRLWI